MTDEDAGTLAALLVKIASTDDSVMDGFYCRLLGNTLIIDGQLNLSSDEEAALRRAVDNETLARLDT